MESRLLGVIATFYGLGALLMLAQRSKRQVGSRTAWAKYVTFAFFLLALLYVAHLGRTLFAVVVLAILVFSLNELTRAAELPRSARLGVAVLGLGVAGTGLIAADPGILYGTAVTLAIVTLVAGALTTTPQTGARSAIWASTGLIAVATPASHLLLLTATPEWFASFAFLLLVVCSVDGFSELVGRNWHLGRGILRVSPDKSLSGLIGGLAAALAMAVAISTATGVWDTRHAAFLGLVVWISASLGDLLASSFKRALGIKDFGTALSAHGGFLDRFDSLFFAAWPYYWMIRG